MDEAETHIVGLLVRARPQALPEVAARLGSQVGVELGARDAVRLALVLEAHGADAVMAFIERARAEPGVLDVALVYQHCESTRSMEESIDGDYPA